MMLSVQGDLGEALFKEWTDEQKRDEIGRLVTGFRAGLPIGIVCNMAEKIAGGEALARRYLLSFLPLEERQGAAATADGGVKELVSRFLGV
jgi:hypothetical protein